MASEKDNGGPLRAGIITNYQIPINDAAERLNEILFNLYRNDAYWRIIEHYYKKFDRQPLVFGIFRCEACDFSTTSALVLLPYRQMFFAQQESHTYIDPREWGPQLNEIFLEGDKLFYVDKRSFASRNEALLVANEIVKLGSLKRKPKGLSWGSKPVINPEDIPSKFNQNLELAIQSAAECVSAGHLPHKSENYGEIVSLVKESISNL